RISPRSPLTLSGLEGREAAVPVLPTAAGLRSCVAAGTAVAVCAVAAPAWAEFAAVRTTDDPGDPAGAVDPDPEAGAEFASIQRGPEIALGPGAGEEATGERPDALAATDEVFTSIHCREDLAGDTLATAVQVGLLPGVRTTIAGTVGDGLHGALDVDLYKVVLMAG